MTRPTGHPAAAPGRPIRVVPAASGRSGRTALTVLAGTAVGIVPADLPTRTPPVPVAPHLTGTSGLALLIGRR
jgi:hypothetical protein